MKQVQANSGAFTNLVGKGLGAYGAGGGFGETIAKGAKVYLENKETIDGNNRRII